MTAVEAVFFDVDDTLVDFGSSNRAAFAAVFSELLGAEAVADGGAYAHWNALTAVVYPRYTGGEIDFLTMRQTRMAQFLQSAGHPVGPAEIEDIERRRLALLDASYVAFDDVLDCLARLRQQGLWLGLITNNESEHQRRKLATTGLAQAFDAVVISGELGVAKPERAIFEHACALLSVDASVAVHVGDNVDTDVQGALRAGIHAIWLDRDGVALELGERVRALGGQVIRSLSELPVLLG